MIEFDKVIDVNTKEGKEEQYLEVNFGIFGVGNNLVQEEEHGVVILELVEEGNDLRGTELLLVLGGDGHYQLSVLWCTEEVLHELQSLLDTALSKECNEELGIDPGDECCVGEDALDVCNLGEVLQSALGETGLFTKLANTQAVVMVEDVVAQNGIGNSWSLDQVDLKQLGLIVTMLRLVSLFLNDEGRKGC